jgi:hypothetical protein
MGAALAAALLVQAPAGAWAQSPERPIMPREAADSTYAVRLEVARLVEAIQHPERSDPRLRESDLRAAAAELDRAARSRPAPPRAELGPAWDLRMEVVAVEPAGPHRLSATVRTFLATDADDAATVKLSFRRGDSGWYVEEHPGLAPRLRAIAHRLARRKVR